MKKESLSRAWLGIFLSALACRLAFLYVWEKHNIEASLGSDGYVTLAQYWAGWIPSVSERILFNTGPGFAFLCYVLFKSVGAANFLLVRVANVLLSSLTCVIAGAYAHKLTGSRVAVLTAALLAFSPTLIFFSPHLQSESFFLFLETVFFYALLSEWFFVSKAKTFGLGFFAGLITLTRSAFVTTIPFLSLAFLWQHRREKNKGPMLALLLLGWILPPLFWGVRNKILYDKFIPLTVQTGVTLYMGLHTDPLTRQDYRNASLNEMEKNGITGWLDQDRFLVGESVGFIKSHPLGYAKIVGIKFFQFWRPWPYPPYPLAARVVLGVYFGALFLLAGCGIWFLRKNLLPYLPMLSMFVCLSILHSLMDASLRYRLPLEPFICLLASVGCFGIWARISKKDAATPPSFSEVG